jgi:predicted secreted hydrolase
MAHFTLTDTASGRFHVAERLGRGVLGIAGANSVPFRVWLDDWQAISRAAQSGLFPLRLEAGHGPVAIELELTAIKPLVLQGQDGWDRKGPEPGKASYYYAFTRLSARGHVAIGDERFSVEGAAWMDREWGSSGLGAGLAGWDWFALQLSDGSELMFYRLRRPDGTAGPFSSGTLVPPAGDKINLRGDEVRLAVRREWRSPRSQRRYPVAWSIAVPSRGLALEIEPMVDNQELDLTVQYWEGAIRAQGMSGGRTVDGQGYLELVGY